MFVRASYYKRREENKLDVTECFIALIICSTCFGHLYAHQQELETILVVFFSTLVMLVALLNRFPSFSKVHPIPQSVLLFSQLCPCLHFLAELQTTMTCSYSAVSDHNCRFAFTVNRLN